MTNNAIQRVASGAAWANDVNRVASGLLGQEAASISLLKQDKSGMYAVLDEAGISFDTGLDLKGGHVLTLWNAGNTNSVDLYHSGTNDLLKTDDSLLVGVDLTVVRDASVGRDLGVTRNATIGNDLTVTRDAGVGRNLDVSGDANIDGGLIVGLDATITGNLGVGVDASVGQDLGIGRDLGVGRHATVTENVVIGGVAAVVDDVTGPTAYGLYADSSLVIVGSNTALSGAADDVLDVIGRAYFTPTTANDSALSIWRSPSAGSGWTLGVVATTFDLIFKDDSDTEIARMGDAGSTYQFTVTGDEHVTGDLVVGGAISGATAVSGLSSLALGATPATTGALRLTNNTGIYERNAANSGDRQLVAMDGSNNINLGDLASDLAALGTSFTVQIGATDVIQASTTVTIAVATEVNDTLTAEQITVDGTGTVLELTGTSQTQTTVGGAGGASAQPATPKGYLKIKVGGNDYVVPYHNPV